MIRRGTYILLMHFDGPLSISVGSLGDLELPAGDYCYVGSAMGGLDQRVGRHLRKDKTVRWHIDHLTTVCHDMRAYESYPDFVSECDLARIVEVHGGIPAAEGFGCSDCRCHTHLFRVNGDVTAAVISDAGLTPFEYGKNTSG
jgi:Uri superfamily endonuclease